MAELEPSAMDNSVMGKLYDVLTNGDDTVPKSDDTFFQWCTPGIPVDPSDFVFLRQGLTGVVKKEALEVIRAGAGGAGGAEGTAPAAPEITPALLEELRGQDANRMYMQAENLSRLLDF